MSLYSLRYYLRSRFLKDGVNTDLDEAISLHRSALDLRLHFLTLCLSNRYDKQGSIIDLDETITHGRAALKLRTPDHSGHAVTSYNLAHDLRRRFLKVGGNIGCQSTMGLKVQLGHLNHIML